jgi:hypothetical protein
MLSQGLATLPITEDLTYQEIAVGTVFAKINHESAI